MTGHVRKTFPGLEATRFYAASSIIIFHVTSMFKLAYPDYLNFITQYFGMGVPLFFIVSAFGLSIGYEKSFNSRQDFSEFYLRRLLRIAPLFYIVMILYIPFWHFTDFAHYGTHSFLVTAAFIHNIIPQHVVGYVWGSWTIGVEMLFYFFFPILTLLVTSKTRAFILIALSFVIYYSWTNAFKGTEGVIKTFGHFFILSHLHYFAAGVLSFHVWKLIASTSELMQRVTGISLLILGVAGIVLLIAFGVEYIYLIGRAFGWDFGHTGVHITWALALGSFVIGITLYPTPVFVGNLRVRWGRASFGIYLWHMMVIGALSKTGVFSFFYNILPLSSLFGYILSNIAVFLIVLPLSVFTFNIIETPGTRMIKHFNHN